MAYRPAILILLVLLSSPAAADQVRVAVAANFLATLKQVATEFEAATGHTVLASSGSTGRQYAQIVNGAPFDVFLAADAERPQQLVAEGYAAATFDYAIGQLFLWSGATELPAEQDMRDWLLSAKLKRVAIANPRLAPYGKAAVQTLAALGVEAVLAKKLVRGESVTQTFQFIASGNAGAGFVARSQIVAAGIEQPNGWPVPPTLHEPILQQGVLIRDTRAAVEFVEFLRAGRARAIIEANGYQVP